MDLNSDPIVRRLAAAGILGGLATSASGVVIQAFIQPASDVSDEMWSYPYPSDALAAVSVLYAGFHLLVFLGMLGFARSGFAGPSRGARVGAGLALVGTFIFFVAEFASIPFSDQRMDDTGPMVVGGSFGLGVTLTAIGLLVAGTATLRAGQWTDWRRFVPLTAGIWSTVLIGISFTKALPTGVAIYGLGLVLLNLAVYTHPTPAASSNRPPQVRARVQ